MSKIRYGKVFTYLSQPQKHPPPLPVLNAVILILLFGSSGTLWDLAAAEVHSRESEDGYGERNVAIERTVFLMGSKAGVCLPKGIVVIIIIVRKWQRRLCLVKLSVCLFSG